MKRAIGCLLVLSTLTFIGCGGKKTITYTRQIGEQCSEVDNCQDGLVCEVGICRVVCIGDQECDAGYKCINQRCTKVSGQDQPTNTDVDHTDIDNTDADTEEKPVEGKGFAYPEGHGLSNIAGTANDGQFKVRILGGSLNGGTKNSTNSVHVNEGTWR